MLEFHPTVLAPTSSDASAAGRLRILTSCPIEMWVRGAAATPAAGWSSIDNGQTQERLLSGVHTVQSPSATLFTSPTVPKEEAEIALETCDSHVVKVPKNIAELSGFIKGMIEDADEGNGESIEVVPLKEHKSCTRKIITRVVEYLKKHAEFEASSSDDEVRPDIHTMFLCVLFADIRWQEVTCVLTYVVLWV